ncbi:MAG: tetratricopeptide (TPR) repeat protein [Cellvibrionaceae bacterium]|jgi:tetratricopeptide (TPR) repeat protein
MLGPLGIIVAVGGFVGDVLQPLLNLAPWVATVSFVIFIGSTIMLVLYRRTAEVELAESLIPAVMVLAAGSTLVFTGYATIYRNAPDRGYIADNVEPVAQLQNTLFGLEEQIEEIGETVERTEDLVIEVATIQADTSVQIDQVDQTVNENQDLLKEIAENQKGPDVMPAGKLLNIAVAEFGSLQNGQMAGSQLGQNVSALIFNQLCDEFLEPEEDFCDPSLDAATELSQLYGDSIALWHDSMPIGQKGITLGMIDGNSPAERSAAAEALANQINANIVIYGYTVNENGSDTIYTNVHFSGEKTRSEPDAIFGTHTIGQPITLLFPEGNESRASELRDALQDRTRALAWITAGLTDDIANNREAALATFERASQDLDDWDDDDGLAVIQLFLGRQAFFLRDYKKAFESLNKALELKPDYPSAHIALGSTYYDHAQLYFLRDFPNFESDCVDKAAIERSASTLAEAKADMAQAQDHFEQAITLAPNSPYPGIVGVGFLMLGQNERLIAQTHLFAGEVVESREMMTSSLSQFDLAQQQFAGTNEFVFRGMAYDGAGGTYTLQAQADLQAGNQAAADIAWQNALGQYEMCLAEEASMPPALFDLMAKFNVFNCGCRDSIKLINEIIGE